MGERGPIPKPSATRRRRNKDSQTETVAALVTDYAAPEVNEDWHPLAQSFYVSLTISAQAQFYEPSDWALAILIADSISRQMKPQVVGVNPVTGEAIWGTVPPNGAQLSAWMKAMHVLLATEGDRRRFRVEVDRSGIVEELEAVPNLDDYRNRYAAGTTDTDSDRPDLASD